MVKKLFIIIGVIILGLAAVFGILKFRDVFSEKQENSTSLPADSSSQNEPTEQQSIPDAFDKTKYSLAEPASPWWVVNKIRPLPTGYVPADLAVPDVKLRLSESQEQMKYSKAATADLIEMFAAASNDGVTLVFGSGYRSESLQRQFYNAYVTQDGQAAADRYSARPGTSEHQTGLSFDATSVSQKCHLEICFKDLPEGQWLQNNAYKYGFIVRYPDGKEPITGYQYEPWHMRWVGIELSTEMHTQNIQTLEEFFDLPPAPSYL